MARLIVDTAANISRARAGNTNPVTVTLSVIDGDGQPIDGIQESAFRSTTLFVGAGGSALELTSVRRRSAPVRGLYDARMAPISGRGWSQGRYLVLIEVSTGDDRGRAIAEVVIP